MDSHSVWVLKRVGGNATTPYLLKAGLNSVGRSLDDNNIVCQSIWVSRHHCDIDVRKSVVFIKDRGSFNGTFIENFRLDSDRFVELKNGDFISLGKAYTKGQILTKDHYVYNILAYSMPQQVQEEKRRSMKRRSSESPIRGSVKRIRGGASPSVTSTTSPKLSADDANVVDVVDLTVDEPVIKTEIHSQPQRKNDIRTDNFQKQASIPLTNRNNNENTTSKSTHVESFISDIEPIANSTLINSALENNRENTKQDVFHTVRRNVLNKTNLENKNVEDSQDVCEQLLNEVENNNESVGNISQIGVVETIVDGHKTEVRDKQTSSNDNINCKSPSGLVASTTAKKDSITSESSNKIQTSSESEEKKSNESKENNSNRRRTSAEEIRQKSPVDNSRDKFSKDFVISDKYECTNKMHTSSDNIEADKIQLASRNSSVLNDEKMFKVPSVTDSGNEPSQSKNIESNKVPEIKEKNLSGFRTPVNITSGNQNSPINKSHVERISNNLLSFNNDEYYSKIQNCSVVIESKVPHLTSDKSSVLNIGGKVDSSSITNSNNESPQRKHVEFNKTLENNSVRSRTSADIILSNQKSHDKVVSNNPILCNKPKCSNKIQTSAENIESAVSQHTSGNSTVLTKNTVVNKKGEITSSALIDSNEVHLHSKNNTQTNNIIKENNLTQPKAVDKTLSSQKSPKSHNEEIYKDIVSSSQDSVDGLPLKMVNMPEIINSDDFPLEVAVEVTKTYKNNRKKSVITSPPSANDISSSTTKQKLEKEKSLLVKNVKCRTDNTSDATHKEGESSCKEDSTLVASEASKAKMPEAKEVSPGSSPLFLGFDNSCSSSDYVKNNSHVSSSEDHEISNQLLENSSKQHINKAVVGTSKHKMAQDFVESSSKQEKYGEIGSVICSVNSITEKHKNTLIKSCRKIKRSNSSFDAQDVEKLLHDLKNTEELDDFEKPTLIIPKVAVQEPVENRIPKSPSLCSKKLNKKASNDLYKKIEQELRNVVGEPSGEDSSLLSSSSRSQDDVNNVPEENPVIEIIDLVDNDDQNNSFSQSGLNTVIEVDENDEVYSQIFPNPDQGTKIEEDLADVKPSLVCPRIIKVEEEDIQEDDELELFESHFSQCSQEIVEQMDDESRQVNEDNLKNIDAKKRKLDVVESSIGVENLTDKTTSCENEEPNSLKSKANNNTVPSRTKKVVHTETVPPEPKKSRNTLPNPAEEVNNEKETVNIPETEELTGVKLIKSTLLSKPPEQEKKRSRGRKTKEEPSVTKQAILKRQQEQIKLERSAKLKNLALQKKTSDNGPADQGNLKLINNKENEKDSSSKCDPLGSTVASGNVAKITERNRSTILLEGFLESKPVTKKRGRPRKNVVIHDSLEIIERKGCQKTDEATTINKHKSCFKSLNAVSPVKKVGFNLKPMIKSYECEGTLTRKVNNSVSKDKAPLRSSPRHCQEINNNEFLGDILHWNASWRKESQIVKGDPPVYRDVFNTKDVFVSYTDYKRWLYPLLLYEVWSSMMKRMDEMENLNCTRTFTGVILSKDIKPSSREKLLTLHCCAPLLTRNAISTFLDPSDILMFYVNTTGKKGLMMYGIVGNHIKFCSARETPNPFARTYLSKLNYRPEYCAYFDVYIYNSPNRLVEVGNNVKIQPTYNISTELKQYEGLKKLQYSPLLDVILDPEKNCTVFLSKDIKDKLVSTYPTLNAEQIESILCTSQTVFSNKPNISLIHGPPGTGKTRVIISIVEQIFYRFKSKNGKKQRILICAQTNAAIDEICLRLLELRKIHYENREKTFRLSRFGRPERTNPKLQDILTYSIAKAEVNKMNLDDAFALELSLLKAQERMAANALESPKEPERTNYKKKYEQIQGSIRELERIVNKTASEEARKKHIEKVIRDEELKVIYHSDIVATTLASCASRRLLKAFNLAVPSLSEEKGEVGVCIVDEASQATDLATLLPLVHDIKNFIFVGDPQQLPPMVNSETSKKNGLSRSLFSRLYKVWSGVNSESRSPRDHLSVPLYKLKQQYRMHPEIAHFPAMAFYKNELETPDFLSVDRGFKPYAVFTHKHLSDPDNAEINQKEAELVLDLVDRILEQPVFNFLSVALIVPYQKQKAIISDILHDKKLMRVITVNTIDSYQGQEKDIVILTCVRTNGLGFLSDYQRTNVAITRAKRGLYIIGNFASLQADPIWKNLFCNAQSRGLHLDLKSSTKGTEIINFIVGEGRRIIR